MREDTESKSIEQARDLAPYGDVALGVECAWPESLPLVRAEDAELES